MLGVPASGASGASGVSGSDEDEELKKSKNNNKSEEKPRNLRTSPLYVARCAVHDS